MAGNLKLMFLVILMFVVNVNADVIYECYFEADEGFVADTAVAGQNGWTEGGSGGWAKVRTTVDADWDEIGEDQLLTVSGLYYQAFTPEFDTSEYDAINITFDMRASDKALLTQGASVYLLGADGNTITRIFFKGTDETGSAGDIQAFNNMESAWDTGLDWAYNDSNDVCHIDITLDQANRKWTLKVDGVSTAESSGKSWYYVNYGGSESTLSKIRFQGGGASYTVGSRTLYDNIVVMDASDCGKMWYDNLGQPSDLNHDCTVDIKDLIVFADYWLQ